MKLPVELSHAEARKLISKALDSKLDHAQAETLEQHLQDCGECRAYAAQLETLDHNLKHELRNRWPEQDSSSSRVAAVYDEIQPALKRNKRKDSRAVTLRSLGWSALAIVLIASLAWTIKTLAPIPSQVPAEETTVEPTSPVLEASQVITPTQAVIANTAEGLLTGSWSATTDFGQLIFTVDEAPARITRIDYLFTNWSCGEITQTSEIVDASSWLFTGNQFTAYSTFDRDGQLTMEINGSYDPASQKLTGTWQQAAQGSLCSGPWEALPATIAAPNLPNAPASQFPNLLITFAASLPSSPTKMMVYQQQLSEAV
ncbi:MAG: hypothetical protein FIA98_09990, partial [Anaerolineae bacterium]|nr:hypothetical protein [Anaerolineae bacterium]